MTIEQFDDIFDMCKSLQITTFGELRQFVRYFDIKTKTDLWVNLYIEKSKVLRGE